MRRTKFRITIVMLTVFLFLSGCTLKNAYKQLDWVLAGMIDDYVSLSESQETDVDARIASFLKWHQFTQLKIYAEDLQQVQQYTSLGLDDASAEDIFQRFMRSWEPLKQHVAPEMADLFLTLNDKQQKQLFEKLAEQNKEIEDDYNEYTEQERYERAGDKMIENFERWLGELNDQQKEVLRSWPPKFKPLDDDRMAFRLKWQAALRNVLQSPLSNADKREQIISMIKNPDTCQTEEHKQKLVYNSKQLKALILSFDQTLTQQQRGFLAARLDYIITTFQELAAEKPSE